MRTKLRELEKLYRAESLPALKRHWGRELVKEQAFVKKTNQKDSGPKPPRSSWNRMPDVKWEPI